MKLVHVRSQLSQSQTKIASSVIIILPNLQVHEHFALVKEAKHHVKVTPSLQHLRLIRKQGNPIKTLIIKFLFTFQVILDLDTLLVMEIHIKLLELYHQLSSKSVERMILCYSLMLLNILTGLRKKFQ